MLVALFFSPFHNHFNFKNGNCKILPMLFSEIYGLIGCINFSWIFFFKLNKSTFIRHTKLGRYVESKYRFSSVFSLILLSLSKCYVTTQSSKHLNLGLLVKETCPCSQTRYLMSPPSIGQN